MAITVSCGGCGTAYKVGDEKAGKKLRCKTCGGVVTVPAAGGGAGPVMGVTRVEKPAARAVGHATSGGGQGGGGAKPAAVPKKKAHPGLEDDGDPFAGAVEASVLPMVEESAAQCPACKATMVAGSVLCVACGYDRRTSKRVGTQRVSAPRPVVTGRGEVERSRVGSNGVTYWISRPFILLPLILVGMMLVGIVVSLVTPAGPAVMAVIALIIGGGMAVVGGLQILGVAFGESFVCGLMYLFLPFYSLYFLITRWGECWRPLVLNLCSLPVLLVYLPVTVGLCGVVASGMHGPEAVQEWLRSIMPRG